MPPRARSDNARTDSATAIELAHRGSGLRPGQLMMLLGLTGFAISQPVLAVVGEDPTLFTFAGVRGSGVVLFALIVALAPPLLLWAFIVVVGYANRRVGDAAFLATAALLAGATVVQWVKSAGVEQGLALGAAGALAALGFALALVRIRPVSMWTRFTAPLPAFAVVLLLIASPAGELLRSPATLEATGALAGDKPSVVFVMFDEFPLKTILQTDGHVDPVRFPNLARFASQSTWYREYTSMAYGTLQAVPSILTGRVPGPGKPLWTDQPDNLFSLLAPTHALTVSETMTQLCGFSSCGIEGSESSSSGSGMSGLLSDAADIWRQRVRLGPTDDIDFGQFAEDVVPLDPEVDRREKEAPLHDPDQIRARPERITDFIEALRPSSSPGLYYLHMMLPHQPWSFYPDGQMHQGISFFGEDQPNDPSVLAQFQQMHMFQAEYADRILGEILDQLEASRLFDKSLIVVTADHGVNFETPPNLRALHRSTIDDLAYVPLMVKEPQQTAGRIDDANLMSMDLLPTIARAVGVEVAWDVDGSPAGSPEIEARGDTKQIYDFGDEMGGRYQGIEEFESIDHRPSADDRLVGPIGPNGEPLSGLMSFLGVEDEMGRDLTELDARPRSGASLWPLAQLRDPPPDQAVTGRITIVVDDPALGDRVLVAINGTVVTAASIGPDGQGSAILPPGALDLAGGNDFALVQIGDDGAHLLDLVE